MPGGGGVWIVGEGQRREHEAKSSASIGDDYNRIVKIERIDSCTFTWPKSGKMTSFWLVNGSRVCIKRKWKDTPCRSVTFGNVARQRTRSHLTYLNKLAWNRLVGFKIPLNSRSDSNFLSLHTWKCRGHLCVTGQWNLDSKTRLPYLDERKTWGGVQCVRNTLSWTTLKKFQTYCWPRCLANTFAHKLTGAFSAYKDGMFI